jgi:hypothetical protein
MGPADTSPLVLSDIRDPVRDGPLRYRQPSLRTVGPSCRHGERLRHWL